MPRFSIVIPTRNRSGLLDSALASAAAQAGNDHEIVVSDNSTEPAHLAAGQALTQSLAGDSRVRYLRPPQPLEMPDHWEFAMGQAGGDYVLVLTDRFVMRPGTLTILANLLDSPGAGAGDAVMWKSTAGYAAEGTFAEDAYTGRVTVRPARQVLEEFAGCGLWRSTMLGGTALPRGLNSMVRRSAIDAVRARHGRAYAMVSPDYTSAFHILARIEALVELDMPLYASHGGESNGASSIRDGVAIYSGRFPIDPFEGCPLPIDTVVNTTVRDYLWVARETGADFPPLDMAGYLLLNYRELQLKDETGSPLDVAGMRMQVLEAAARLSADQRAAFAKGKAIVDARDTVAFRLRNRLAKAGVLPAAKKVAAALGLYGNRSGRRYASVLEAIAEVPLRPELTWAADAVP